MIDSLDLPFHDLYDDEFFNEITPSNSLLTRDRIQKMKDVTFNPFSSNGRGREYITFSPDFDPGNTYLSQTIRYVDDRC